jgi:L-fuculose-phosphate aldolase
MKEGRISFNLIFISNETPSRSGIQELNKWCGEFQKHGLTPVVDGNYTGNLSFRSNGGFVITASGLKSKENLSPESFVYIKKYDKKTNTFFVVGKKMPSSESIMHYLIYKYCKRINSVFHGHHNLIVVNARKMGLTITEKEFESGTLELAKEVLRVLGNNKIVVLKNHGFVSFGKTMKEAGESALCTLKHSKNANKIN